MDNSVQMPVRVLWKDIGGYCHGNKLWFVHRDRLAEHRYSDGAQLCVVPQLGEPAAAKAGDAEEVGKQIYFYCDEYQLLWDSLDTVGRIECALPDRRRITIRPTTLPEICAAGLCECVDEVVEIDAMHTVTRIQLG